jgi:hypothetical protein
VQANANEVFGALGTSVQEHVAKAKEMLVDEEYFVAMNPDLMIQVVHLYLECVHITT